MLRECEAEHLSSGALIVWTDGRRTCHVAMHESAMRRDEFFQRCRDARKLLKDPWGIGVFQPILSWVMPVRYSSVHNPVSSCLNPPDRPCSMCSIVRARS